MINTKYAYRQSYEKLVLLGCDCKTVIPFTSMTVIPYINPLYTCFFSRQLSGFCKSFPMFFCVDST